jgi:hypothetical protein
MIPLRNVDIAKAFSQPGIKAGMTHQIVANEIPTKTPIVYFIRIGRKTGKIGFTTNLEHRLKSFTARSTEPIYVIATFPGGSLSRAIVAFLNGSF